ncbi:S41 family peptidase [Variovorax sp. NFACC27]|uniref:S41 family peptidase n=1 Tax=unclassified Variovorax TaxID=663243 RepID=UPI0008991E0C|nr:carboxyl-terminal processing protease [Variovorax sp. NFACC28]SEG98138.1 carboxyl-terminal processing protease [Variovorax sp. NFACC29]SFE04890.1 carboxyl-terminal processing protease [Variovorax sp. NFACC26]SFH12956.1 carboxyl-terminal processing protease [Variovorax sp. NFACC27]
MKVNAMGASPRLAGSPPKKRVLRLMGMALLSVLAGSACSASPQDDEDAYARVVASSAWRSFALRVSQNYVRPIKAGELEASCRGAMAGPTRRDDASLAERCFRAALAGLDSTSLYFNAAEWRAQRGDAPGSSAGIGLEMRAHAGGDGFVEIVSPIKGAPAQRAGLRAGDLIMSIDGVPTRSLSLAQSVRALRGEAETRTALLVQRPGVPDPLRFVVTRAPIQADTVKSGKLLAPGVGYFRVLQFQDRTRNEVLADVAKLEADNGGPLHGLVLDLRDSPGGLLSATVGLAALFLKPGAVVVQVAGQHAGMNRTYRAVPGDHAGTTPAQVDAPMRPSLQSLRLVVLVNGKTGAGAEALAKALQESRQAMVLGQPTAGLASIETVLPVEFDTALKLTTGTMSSPSGASWQGRGVVPDVLVKAGGQDKGALGDIPADVQLMAAMARLQRP